MKTDALYRIALLVCTVVVVGSSPLWLEHFYAKETVHVAKSTMPLAGEALPVAGQEPVEHEVIVLKANEVIEIGELLRLDARESQVDDMTWGVRPFTDDFEVIDGGLRAMFSSREPGEWLIMISASKDNKAYLKYLTVIVEGEAPDTPTTINLERKVATWMKKVEEYDGKKLKAQQVAGVFRETAHKTDVPVKNMLETTALATTAVLGDDLEKWAPFLDTVGHELDDYIAEFDETDPAALREQYKKLWLEIANGIERAVR